MRRPSRFLWAFTGTVAFAGIAAQVCMWFLPHDYSWWQRIILAVCVGLLCGSALAQFSRVVQDERMWRAMRHLPVTIGVEEQEDGTRIAFVTQVDGSPRLLTLPEGYDPREDDGRRLLELLAEPE